MTKQKSEIRTQFTPKKINKKTIIITASILLLIIVGMVSGQIGYLIAYAKCGTAPINATKFAASWSYFLPGELGYGPSPYNSGYFCTQTDAEAAGYHHNPLAS
jgi:hypothetical protein